MDPKELRGLMEAYSEVYAPQEEIEEAVKGTSRHDTEMRKAAASERRSGVKNRLSASAGKATADKMERDVKYMDKLTKNNKIIVGMAHEEVSVFDVVLEFLQAEGFAETLEDAEWMMANVIDEEAISIVLGEAQAARENPEKYEREQSKKYAPVRGEKTPMPPRGDKRREDFEKWYAANVR